MYIKLFRLEKSIHNWFQLRYKQLLLRHLHPNKDNYCAHSSRSLKVTK